MQITSIGANGIDVNFGGWGWDKLGSFHLQIIFLNEKPPDCLSHPGAQPQVLLPVG
jgi:hypothetical protein